METQAAPKSSPGIAAPCDQHPRQPAVAACGGCGKHLCTLCTYEVNGRAFCGDCGVTAASAAPAAAEVTAGPMEEETAPTTAETPPRWGRQPETGFCADHPEVAGVVRCKLCLKWVCATCDFALPGDVHLCPSCIEHQSTDEVNPKRKRLSYIALAMAIWSTILCALMFGGAFASLFTDDAAGKAADLLITNIILWPLLIGFGLSMSALDKRLNNTGLMKGVAWWNGILGGLFLLLIVAANLGLIG